MLVFRITTAKWADKLTGSNQPARWNSAEKNVLYAAQSRSLACLENVVHRDKKGLNQFFKVVVIEIPDTVSIKSIETTNLINDWSDFKNIGYTRNLGDDWYSSLESCLLKIPSAIIDKEFNYLINTKHPDFQQIKIIEIEDFNFDSRIKE